jgi:hypothetical protein
MIFRSSRATVCASVSMPLAVGCRSREQFPPFQNGGRSRWFCARKSGHSRYRAHQNFFHSGKPFTKDKHYHAPSALLPRRGRLSSHPGRPKSCVGKKWADWDYPLCAEIKTGSGASKIKLSVWRRVRSVKPMKKKLPIVDCLSLAGLLPPPVRRRIPGRPVAARSRRLIPQLVRDQQDMTWDDYKPIPGTNWADPAIKPKRGFRMALVAVDFPDQPFVITMPKHSDPFRQSANRPHFPRNQVAQFYADFYNKPPSQSRPHHQRLLDGAIARPIRHHQPGSHSAPTGCRRIFGVRPR